MNISMPDGSLIACVGNSLCCDDAVGWAVYDVLKARKLPADVRLLLSGVGGIALLDDLKGEKLLIVVDAVQLGFPPGTVHVLSWNDIPGAGGAAVSLHGLGIRETIDIGRTLYPEDMPDRVFLVGIEGECFDRLGEPMTQPVANAVDEAVEQVLKLIM